MPLPMLSKKIRKRAVQCDQPNVAPTGTGGLRHAPSKRPWCVGTNLGPDGLPGCACAHNFTELKGNQNSSQKYNYNQHNACDCLSSATTVRTYRTQAATLGLNRSTHLENRAQREVHRHQHRPRERWGPGVLERLRLKCLSGARTT